MSAAFRLRFPVGEIGHWSARFQDDDEPVERLVPKVKGRGFLTKAEFLVVCRWKTARSQSRCRENSEEFVRAVTACSLGSNDERLRIEVLTLLSGVSWPTASVILHFFHSAAYPILDFRALWSLQCDVPAQYDFQFWWDYTRFCCDLSRRTGESMRTIDRALWQFSKENQP